MTQWHLKCAKQTEDYIQEMLLWTVHLTCFMVG